MDFQTNMLFPNLPTALQICKENHTFVAAAFFISNSTQYPIAVGHGSTFVAGSSKATCQYIKRVDIWGFQHKLSRLPRSPLMASAAGQTFSRWLVLKHISMWILLNICFACSHWLGLLLRWVAHFWLRPSLLISSFTTMNYLSLYDRSLVPISITLLGLAPFDQGFYCHHWQPVSSQTGFRPISR